MMSRIRRLPRKDVVWRVERVYPITLASSNPMELGIDATAADPADP
jgi:hypothetical protein